MKAVTHPQSPFRYEEEMTPHYLECCQKTALNCWSPSSIASTKESGLIQGHECFPGKPSYDWSSTQVLYPCSKLEQLWRIIPSPDHVIRSPKVPSTESIPNQFSLCPFLLPPLPVHRKSSKPSLNLLSTNFLLRVTFLADIVHYRTSCSSLSQSL